MFLLGNIANGQNILGHDSMLIYSSFRHSIVKVYKVQIQSLTLDRCQYNDSHVKSGKKVLNNGCIILYQIFTTN